MSASKSTCERIQSELQSYALETLSDKSAHAVADHLDVCSGCRAALEKEKQRLAALRGSMPPDASPAELAERTIVHVATAGNRRARRLTLVETLTTVAIVGVILAIILPALSRPREAARRASTQNNMKQLGLIFKMYANESEGARFPEMAPEEDAWAFDVASLYSDYLTDPGVMVSEEHPESAALKESLRNSLSMPSPDFEKATELLGESFAYLNYSVSNESEFEALARARATGRLLEADTEMLDAGGGRHNPPHARGRRAILNYGY